MQQKHNIDKIREYLNATKYRCIVISDDVFLLQLIEEKDIADIQDLVVQINRLFYCTCYIVAPDTIKVIRA